LATGAHSEAIITMNMSGWLRMGGGRPLFVPR
jgi:hypothetical protein